MFIYFKEYNLQHSNFECMLHCRTYLHILVTYMFPSDFFFKLLLSTFITKYCLHSYFGGWKWDCNLCDDAGDRSSS